jgi:hypothetical protein
MEMPRWALGIEGRLPVRSPNGDCALRLRFAEKNLPAVRTEAVHPRGPSLAACLLMLIAELSCSPHQRGKRDVPVPVSH